MASTTTRRPLPALVALVALLLLTGLVWWRVLNRGGASASGSGAGPTCVVHTPAVTLPAQRSVLVQVLNSTTRQGIGARARTALLDAGFDVPTAAVNDNKRYQNKIAGVAQIRFGPTGRTGAILLRYYLPGATLSATKSTTRVVVVSLGRKYIRVASPTVVQAALKKAHAVAGSPTPSPSSC